MHYFDKISSASGGSVPVPPGDFRPSDPLLPIRKKILRASINKSLALLLFGFHVVDRLLFRLLKTRFCTLFLKRFSRLVVRIKPREMRKKCDVQRSSRWCTYVLYMQVIVLSTQRAYSGSTGPNGHRTQHQREQFSAAVAATAVVYLSVHSTASTIVSRQSAW